MSNRQTAIEVLRTNKVVLNAEGPKAFRAVCLLAIKAQTSAKDIGATFNDAKHILINAGELEAFGRHGKGRNHNSAPKVVEPVREEGDKWQVVNKETGAVMAYAASRAKAIIKRNELGGAEAGKVVKL